MSLYKIHKQQFLRRPLGEVFAFFSQPENLAKITPEEMGFVILTPLPITMKAGALIDYTIKILGTRVRWTTLITDYEPPLMFVDVQLKGPYSYWHHRHKFTEQDGGTLIEDEIQYAMPFGLAGKAVHALVVGKQLQRIFEHRAKVIERLFADEYRQADTTTVAMKNSGGMK